jgi:trehalose utilization protein
MHPTTQQQGNPRTFYFDPVHNRPSSEISVRQVMVNTTIKAAAHRAQQGEIRRAHSKHCTEQGSRKEKRRRQKQHSPASIKQEGTE